MDKINSGTKKIVLLAICLCAIATLHATKPLQAAESRIGVLLPEQQQRQRAVIAASGLGDAEPLEASEVPTTILKKEVLVRLEEPSVLEKNAEESLAPITLEDQILEQNIDAELELFGYNLFTGLPSTFAPVEGIPVPPDYIVGPGDSFILQIFSATDVQYTLVVTREGKLLVPEIGDLQVAGLTFEEAKVLITETITQSRLGVKVVVTLSNLHSIQVMIVGEVVQPGSYTVSGLSTLVNTLITTGGIRRTGTLRDIQVKRSGRVVAQLDLYDLLLRGDSSNNIFLRQGDVVFVPPIGRVVSVAGEVVRPAIYEIDDEETVADAIQLAGGLLPTADPRKTQVERVQASGSYTLLQASTATDGAFLPIKSGDLIRVFPVLNKMDNVVLLEGNTLTPGGYQWRAGMRVSDLIDDLSTLRQSTDFSIANIQRENSTTKRMEAKYFNLNSALRYPGSSGDPILEPRDRVVVFDVAGKRSAQLGSLVQKIKMQASGSDLPAVFTLRGAVKHGGDFPLAAGQRLLDVIGLGGGINKGVDRNYTLIVRTDATTNAIEFIGVSLTKALASPEGDHNPRIQPGDRVYLFDSHSNRSSLISGDLELLRKQASYDDMARVVEISGSVASPGRYPLLPGARLEDLIRAAGGLAEDSFGMAATLARQEALDGEFSRTKQIPVSLMSSDVMVNGLNLVLQPYDHLVVRQKPEWITKPKRVTISGEVLHPGTYEVDKRETLCGLVQKSGGLLENAYLFGTVFTRESVRKREQEAIDRIHRQIDDLLAEVHLSPGFDKDTKMPVNQSTYDTFRVIQQLKPEKAVGRMVIDMEKAVKRCDETYDVVLEDGDKIMVPAYQEEVSVVGQVYFPASHQYRTDRSALDYINLSGGTKELAQHEHLYIVQANGEVMTGRSIASTWGWLGQPNNVKVTPGSTIYVPLSVDRINGREFAQSWVDLVYKLTLSAASIDFLFGN